MQRETPSLFGGTFMVVNEKSQCHLWLLFIVIYFQYCYFHILKQCQATINCVLHLTEWNIEEMAEIFIYREQFLFRNFKKNLPLPAIETLDRTAICLYSPPRRKQRKKHILSIVWSS